MSGGVVSHPSVRDRIPDVDDWGIVSRVIGGGGFVIADQIRPSVSVVTAIARTTVTTTFATPAAGRLGINVYNNSNGFLYVKLGTGATTASFTVRLGRQSFYEVQWPNYTGTVTGVWGSAGAGTALVTELS